MATAFKTEIQPVPFIHPDDMPDVYALTGTGVCMAPVLQDGSLLAFDKRKAPVSGDIVGIIFTQEAAARRGVPGLVKRLVIDGRSDASGFVMFPPGLIVEQLNPAQRITIPAEDVLAVHKYIGTAKRAGEGRAAISRDLL